MRRIPRVRLFRQERERRKAHERKAIVGIFCGSIPFSIAWFILRLLKHSHYYDYFWYFVLTGSVFWFWGFWHFAKSKGHSGIEGLLIGITGRFAIHLAKKLQDEPEFIDKDNQSKQIGQ